MFTLGVVSFLNSLPLYHSLEAAGAVRLIREVPALLTGRLASGECDAALIPIVDHLRGVGGPLVSDAGICCHGAVRSVLLFTKIAPTRLRSVAVDTSSHTSVALLRVLLADGCNVTPPFVECAPDIDSMLAAHDGALIIGDRALDATTRAKAEGWRVLDLGTAWLQLTGLPFVFAAWVARAGLDAAATQELGTLLSAARDAGRARIAEFVAENPLNTKLPNHVVESYLRDAIGHELTPAHHAAIAEFRQRCERHNLLS